LPHTGEHYVFATGASNTISTPVTEPVPAAAEQTIFTLNRESVTGVSGLYLCYFVSGPARFYFTASNTSNNVTLTLSKVSDGGSIAVNIPLSGAANRLNHRLTVDWNHGGAGVARATVEYSDDDSVSPTWSVAGFADFAEAVQRPSANATVPIGAISTVGSIEGGLRRATLSNDGTTKFDAYPNRDIDTAGNPNAGQASWVSATGETWTVNRSATGLKTAVVTRPVPLLDGTDDYIQLPASDTPDFTATTGKYTVVVAFRVHQVSTTFNDLWGSRSSATIGANLYWDSGNPRLGLKVAGADSGVFHAVRGVYTVGELAVVAAVFDEGQFRIYENANGLSVPNSYASVGAITHATPRINTYGYLVSSSTPLEVFSCRTFKGQALTETELDAIAAELIAGSYA
jgi:hypothetical protein